MSYVPLFSERSKLYNDYHKQSGPHVEMTQFILKDAGIHAEYMRNLFRLLKVEKKFTPPAYFYIMNTELFKPENSRVSAFTEDHRPFAYPLVSIHAPTLHGPSEFSSNGIPEPNMHLLKPMLGSSPGNYEFAEGLRNYIFLNDATLHNKTAQYDNIDYLMSWKEPELTQLFPFITGHVTSDYSFPYPASFFHAEASSMKKGKIVPTEEVMHSLDFQLFKQFWPIFDWDMVGKTFPTILRPNISL